MPDPAPLSLLDTFELIRQDLDFVGGCVLTDRPDLPLSPETSWTMDFTRLFGAIDDAIDQLVGADRRTGLGCAGCSRHPPIRLISERTRFVPARPGKTEPAVGLS